MIIALGVVAGWQIASCEWAYYELREDLRDIAAQNGARIGLNTMDTDDAIRGYVIGRAKQHAIELQPSEVTVQRTGTAEAQGLYVAVDYYQAIKLAGLSFKMHFTADARGRPILPTKG